MDCVPGVQHNATVKLLAHDVAQMAQAFEIAGGGLCAGLDFDTDDAALAVLGNEIDLNAGGGAVVHQLACRNSSIYWCKFTHLVVEISPIGCLVEQCKNTKGI